MYDFKFIFLQNSFIKSFVIGSLCYRNYFMTSGFNETNELINISIQRVQ